uniref:Uncharacterized protein n=1 Tax=Eucampia antarctica TaxID=49252 RepID=A0A7S2S1F9_9STRA|mmetsp:Transcript_29677/g.28534  ORF Transcript_29677/g.28534 Transcript_29677/m.28534 type:complete len:202 (+) Transcript_29677:92-697(+)|eukprot:CAMPEP_0197832126 /NCGR_PEP_ID=MMETSP1437-20131217/13409_1 /TAXON_ID=49252 ORGANISM="Eucampia antarctica, Strain CCMP1452" /NCGR_SAMPLE_ID=MMETSP1437 /ASSEMBLY_ACC=CAM_ASM_001096 /LENGTH=201 /DNA_ID=CAMNT_0043435329 /DNA_START=67 /DNA_END=672 /DNA_ORIENTATION=-
MRSTCFFLLLSTVATVPAVFGFSAIPKHASSSATTSQLDAEISLSRRLVIESIFALATVSATTVALPAYADVTNKVASQSALRTVKRTVKELQKLEFVVADNNYAGLKEGLRVPPFTDVRKNCNVLIRGGEDGPEQEALQKAYGEFIKNLEDLDSQASLGARGRKDIKLMDSFDRSVKSLLSFEEVAERAVGIPLQVESPQ